MLLTAPKRRGHATPCRATWGSARLVRRQKELGKGMVRAHIVIPREEMGEGIGKFKQV